MIRRKHKTPKLYGFHAVRQAWLNENRLIEALYITPQAAKGFEKTLLEGHGKGLRRPEPTTIEKPKLEKLLPKGAVHQGIALCCAPLDELNVQDLIIKTREKNRALFVILDQITDPHNVGAILRSACAFGVDGIIMQTKHAPELAGVLAKTASGAVEHICVAHATNLSRAIEDLQQAGFGVIGLDERGEETINSIKTEKTVIVLGSEGTGIRPLVKEKCNVLVRLPTQEPIASLNVSNAAAVTFYALMK